MKTNSCKLLIISAALILMVACNSQKQVKTQLELRDEVFKTEKEFETTAKNIGIEDAFFSFADVNAIIKRGNDSLIIGNEGIRNFYSNPKYKDFDLSWTPDFVDVSDDGCLAYTYGKYTLKTKDLNGNLSERTGVFHTVWKRQKDGKWKYVWD